MNHEFVLLEKHIEWEVFSQEFAPYYSDKGAPSAPIRLMVGYFSNTREEA